MSGPESPSTRREAGWLFVLFTGLGSVTLLVGVLALVRLAGTSDLGALAAGAGSGLTPGQQLLVAALLTAGQAIKVPVWPLHTWLPVAHSSAPTAGSMLLAAVLLKILQGGETVEAGHQQRLRGRLHAAAAAHGPARPARAGLPGQGCTPATARSSRSASTAGLPVVSRVSP